VLSVAIQQQSLTLKRYVGTAPARTACTRDPGAVAPACH
ncbi:MAG: hypothetical protein QOH95_760, partial [Gaiellaceae bacterium]|nr:hypothetical protein [Gaiellaceae bacterium]